MKAGLRMCLPAHRSGEFASRAGAGADEGRGPRQTAAGRFRDPADRQTL